MKETRYPLHSLLGGPQAAVEGKKDLFPLQGFEPRTCQG